MPQNCAHALGHSHAGHERSKLQHRGRLHLQRRAQRAPETAGAYSARPWGGAPTNWQCTALLIASIKVYANRPTHLAKIIGSSKVKTCSCRRDSCLGAQRPTYRAHLYCFLGGILGSPSRPDVRQARLAGELKQWHLAYQFRQSQCSRHFCRRRNSFDDPAAVLIRRYLEAARRPLALYRDRFFGFMMEAPTIRSAHWTPGSRHAWF